MVTKLIILPLLVLSSLGVAQVDFSASVQTNGDVSTDDQFRLTISYKKKGQFSPPAFKDFHAQGGRESWSGSHMIVNGKVVQDDRSFTRTYVLQAKKQGKLVIEAAKLVVNGKTYHTAPITLNVKKGEKPQYAAGEFDPNAQLIAKMYVSKRDIYKGEALTLTYKAYTPFRFRQLTDLKIQSYKGFNKHSLLSSKIKQYDVKTERINGRQYQVITLEKELLVATNSGQIKLDPFEIEVVLTDSWGFNTAQAKVKSNPVTINVKSLPKSGQPDDFTGAVGKFDITAESSSDLLTEDDDGFDLKVTISGKGNVDFDDPKIELRKEFDAYPPESDEDQSISSSGISIKKTYNFFTVPQQNGDFELGPFTFSYFDPELGQYITASTEPIIVVVNNPNIKAERIAGDKKLDIDPSAKELRFIKTETNLENQDEFLAGSTKYWIGLGSPLLLFLLLIFVRRKRKEEDSDAMLNKRAMRAGKVAKQRLNKAAGLIASNDHAAFFDENLKALYAYLSEKIHMQAHDMSKHNIKEQLENLNVSTGTAQKFVSILESCEMARYAAFSQNAKDIYEQSLQVIMDVEKEIKPS